MKVLFAGSPEIAVPLLERLAEAHKVQVLTNPDMPSGRGRKLTPNPVKAKVLELGFPVDQPERLDSEFTGNHWLLGNPRSWSPLPSGKSLGQSF
jgi:methionyl-tRNA formyltransferase